MEKYKYGHMYQDQPYGSWYFAEEGKPGRLRIENHIAEYCLNELGKNGWRFVYRDKRESGMIYTLMKKVK